MEKIADDDAAYYRQRTVARLIDKRRQLESAEAKEAELKKLEELKFRIQWKEGFKKKRSELISTKVDKNILQSTLKCYPEMLVQVINMEKYGILENVEDDTLMDLVDDYDEGEVENAGVEPTLKSFHSGSMFPTTIPQSSQAYQFLQNAATFKMAVNHRLKEQQCHNSKSLTDAAHPSADGSKSESSAGKGLQSTSSTTFSSRVQDSRMFSSYRNEVKVNNLVLNLLQGPQTSSSVTDHSNSLVNSLTAGRRIKTTGLMSKLFHDTSALAVPAGPELQRVNSFTVHRSTNITPGSRTFASATKRGGDNNSAGSVTSASDEVSKGLVPDAVVASVNNAMFCSLADSLFLIGPSAQSIQEHIDAHTSSVDGSAGPTVSDFNANLPSTIIFVTDSNSPPEMFTLLPCYTYPSGVEVGVRSAKNNVPSTPTTNKRRKHSLNLLTQKIISESITDAVKGVKKKNTAFFPSDFNLGATMGLGPAAGQGTKSEPAAAVVSEPPPSLPAVNTHMSARNPFILLLGDHTYQQYGLCIQLPVTFQTDQGLTIQTSYVLCLMTKLPLFSYLFHILDQYDTFFDGFKFKEPIPTQDMNFPFLAELKPLSDLAAKLKRLLVPKYPYIINSALNTAPASTRKRTSTEASILVSTTAATSKNAPGGGMLENEYPALDNESDTKALLPDIDFGYGGININKKLHATFKRSVYQSYFSSSGLKYDAHNKVISDLIARYDKMAADFMPNATHKQEKDREESYLVMLWALPVLLKYLPLDQIILALGCAVTEMKIIVKHPDFHVISAIILAFMQLLRPLRWCSPVIVILPDQYQEIIESPTPVMIGMQRLPEHFTLLEGFVVVDPQERIVHLNPIDVVESHTILLPHGSKLVNALSSSAETILKCTKKKRHTKQNRRSLQPDAELAAETQLPAGATVPSIFLPLPVELDTNSYENLQLLAAVKTFAGLVSNHIQAILNTAIQMQQQSKQASQEQRRLLIRSASGARHSNKNAKPKPSAAASAPAATSATNGAPALSAAVVPALAIENSTSQGAGEGSGKAGGGADASKQKVTEAPSGQESNRNSYRAEASLSSPKASDSNNFPGAALISNVHSPLAGEIKATDSKAAVSKDTHVPNKLTPKNSMNSKSSHYMEKKLDGSVLLKGLHSPSEHSAGQAATKTLKAKTSRHSLPPTGKKGLPVGKEIDDEAALHDDSPLRGGKPLKTRQTLLHHPNTGAEERRKKLHKAADVTDKDRRRSTGNHKGIKAAPPKKVADDKAKPHKPAGAAGEAGAQTAPNAPAATNAVLTPVKLVADASATVAKVSALEPEVENAEVFAPFTPIMLGAAGRNTSAAAGLVFNIDTLVSPFVFPPTKLGGVSVPAVAASDTVAVPERAVVSPVFVNLPRGGSADDGDHGMRDSLNDETCSEITVTDAGGGVHAAGDDGSGGGGNRVRTESSNDSGDKMSDIAESHCSSASSLPSLKSNAPLLLVREIGQSGAKFMDKIQETQMYSNYCQYVKTQSALAAAKLAEQKASLIGGLTSITQVASLDALDTTPRTAAQKNAWSQLHMSVEGETVALKGGENTSEEDEVELDSLQEVFSILLTGTVAHSDAAFGELTAKYDELYGDRPAVSANAILRQYGDVLAKVKQSDLDAVYDDAIRKYNTSHPPAHKPASPSGTAAGALAEEAVSTTDAEVIWCNGLLCAGMCNTPYCASICMDLWEYKVKKLRQQAVFRNIITKNHQPRPVRSNHVLQSVTSPTKSTHALELNGKTVHVAVQSKVDVIKHGKETQSQYEQRKALVESRKAEFLRLHSPNPGNEADARSMAAKQRSVYGPAQRDLKKLIYARGRTSDPATLAIAKYYAVKQAKVRKSQEKRALRVIKPLMMRFICLYRRFKFFNAIYVIQALIRGFYVRNHIPELVEALIARRIRRLLACIRIRRFLRQRADQIYRRHVRAKIEEQRRRRATLSIPVKLGTHSTKGTADTKSSAHRQPRKVYSLSDDILPTTGISIVGLENQKLLQQLDAPVSTRIATSVTKPSAADLHTMTNEKAVVEIYRSSGKEPGPEGTLGFSEAAPVDNAGAAEGARSAKDAGSQKVAPKYSTGGGTYTDRVKEYLQFGKIIHRTASSTVVQTQNKYAAHYMQKRNSKTAKGAEGMASPEGPTRSASLTSLQTAPPAALSPEVLQTGAPTAVAQLFPTVSANEPASGVGEEVPAEQAAGDSTVPHESENPFAQIVADSSPDTVKHTSRVKVDLRIATQFSHSTEDGEDTGDNFLLATQLPTMGESTIGSPSSAFSVHLKEDRSEIVSEVVEAIEVVEIISPTSGIRTLNVTYNDSDDEAEKNNCSLRFSDMGSEYTAESSPLSLLAMNLVEGSLKHMDSTSTSMKDSSEWLNGSPGAVLERAAPSITKSATISTMDDDDRASVLSSNSNSTTPKRRSSYNGSTTDQDTQPVLHSILGQHRVVSMLAMPTEHALQPDKHTSRSHDLSDAEQADDHQGRSDDCTVATVSSVRSTRTDRSSFGNSAARHHNNSSMIIDGHQSKKLSPIGRYAAEKSYNMTRIFTPHTGLFSTSKIPFHANPNTGEGDETTALLGARDVKEPATLSPLQKLGPPVHPPPSLRTPRESLSVTDGNGHNKPVRRQSLLLNSNFMNRRTSAHEGHSADKTGVAQQDKLSSLSSYPIDDIGVGPDSLEDTTHSWAPVPIKDRAQRRSTIHFYGGGPSNVPGVVVTKSGSMSQDPDDFASAPTDSLTFTDLRVTSSEVEEWLPPQEEHSMMYHRHSKGSPKGSTGQKSNIFGSVSRDADSPVRSSHDYRQAIDLESHTYKSNKPVDGLGKASSPKHSSQLSSQIDKRDLSRSMDDVDAEDFEEGEDDDLEFMKLDDLQEAVKAAPLKTLGCNVTDFINRQQLTTLLDMWSLLRDGVEVLKHGRRGNPKFKTLLCDVNLTKLYWRSPGSKPDADQDNLPDDLQYYPTLLDPTAGAAELANGVAPLDSAPTSNTARMPRTAFGTKSNADRVLYIRDIIEVREDLSTEVMQRSLAKKFVSVGTTSVISIVLVDRTLDFEIEEVNWGSLFHALQILVNFYQVMVPSPRVTLSAPRLPEGFFNFLTYDSSGPSGAGMQYSSAPRRKRAGSGFGGVLRSRSSMKMEAEESENLI